MKEYESPIIIPLFSMSEGIFASSGSVSKCKSIYMSGVYQQPTYNPMEDGYKKGKGCEGCPASNGSGCRFSDPKEEANKFVDYRPSWEIQGHLPDEKGY